MVALEILDRDSRNCCVSTTQVSAYAARALWFPGRNGSRAGGFKTPVEQVILACFPLVSATDVVSECKSAPSDHNWLLTGDSCGVWATASAAVPTDLSHSRYTFPLTAVYESTVCVAPSVWSSSHWYKDAAPVWWIVSRWSARQVAEMLFPQP